MRRTRRLPHHDRAPAGEPNAGGTTAPRYVIERRFPDGLAIATDVAGAFTCLSVVDRIAEHGAQWVHSYDSDDMRSTFFVDDGPHAVALRAAARDTDLPIEPITKVTVLDPHQHRGRRLRRPST